MASHSEKAANSYHHGDLREALLSAAIKFIREGGFQQMSLRALARRAGVSPAAPYHHFKDKNELLAEVATDSFRRMTEDMQRAQQRLPERADAVDRFIAIGRSYMSFAIKHPAHFQVMFGPILMDKAQYPHLQEAASECFEQLHSTVTLAFGEDGTPEAIRNVALTSWSTVHGAAVLWNQGPLKSRSEARDAEEAIRIVCETACRLLPTPVTRKAGKTNSGVRSSRPER
jgi:AcrR family transcriptional regulator